MLKFMVSVGNYANMAPIGTTTQWPNTSQSISIMPTFHDNHLPINPSILQGTIPGHKRIINTGVATNAKHATKNGQ